MLGSGRSLTSYSTVSDLILAFPPMAILEGTVEHTAHPGAVFSLLWPLGCSFLPSEQAE